jgi:hypothetical protein
MNWLRSFYLLLAMGVCTYAWGQDEGGQDADPFAAEHQRIETIRSQKTLEFDAQEQACWSKFAVTGCRKEVGARRRQMLADLKRQEVEINAAQRKQKAAQQLQSNADKLESHAQHAAELLADDERKSQEDRQKELDEKALNHKQQAHPGEPKAPKTTSTLDAQTVEKNRQAYADKLKELEKRRQERDKKVREHSSDSTPLPPPE